MVQQMDNYESGDKLAKLLAATLNANLRKQAENELTQLHTLNGFTPTLLQLIMSDQIEMPVRQAGVIYLKNMITQYWHERKPENPEEQMGFALIDSDKQLIRDNLIESIIHAPETIRVQLIVCVRTIASDDFPDKWPTIIDKVIQFIQTNNLNAWYGALQAFYQICKNYEYKSNKERGIYHKSMRILLPLFIERIFNLKDDHSDLSVLTQKQILKIFYTFIQFMLPLDVLDNQHAATWIEICNAILQTPIPNHVEEVDKDERPDLSWWKIKKWSLRILNRIFERYGTPNSVSKEYNEFANFFLKGYTIPIVTNILKILENYRNGVYISPRVLQQSIVFIELAVGQSFTWKFLKPHMFIIIQEILYPLLCHTDEDDELFENDPIEYIKAKYDVFEDFISPVNAAKQLIYQVSSKRKDILQKTMMFAMQLLQSQALNARQKDGILHIVGTVAKILLKKNLYKDQVELMLVTYVYPEFQSTHGFLRARACWVLKSFAKCKFKSHDNLMNACNYVKHCILNDTCLPVSVEACLALQDLLTEDEIEINQSVKDNFAPHIQQIVIKMLNLIRDTENDDISNVIQRLIYVYEDEISTFAVDIMKHLCETFLNLVNSSENDDQDSETKDDKTITAVGILSTIESILNVMEEKCDVLNALEQIMLPVLYAIIQNGMIDFYEELFSLICTLTTRQISANMWPILYLLHNLFQQDAFDYFTELMPVLHNYIMVDTKTFLSDAKNLECVFKMIKHVLNSQMEDDESESHAAKLLEIIILQCHHSIESVLGSFLELIFQRLHRGINNTQLRTMCLQVIITALWTNTDAVLRIFDSLSQNSNEPLLLKFIQQWLNDIDCFMGLHDRKICALGLCTILELTPKRPHDLAQIADKLLPSCCIIYENLERVYEERAKEDSDADDNDYDTDVNELESDEDDESNSATYMEKLQRKLNKQNGSNTNTTALNIDNNQNLNQNETKIDDNQDDSELDDESDDDDDDDEFDKTQLENYNSAIDDNDNVDEFIIFKDTLQNLQINQTQYYDVITSPLTPDQCKLIQNIIINANRRAAEKESRKILASGGYSFTNLDIPTSFNFGN